MFKKLIYYLKLMTLIITNMIKQFAYLSKLLLILSLSLVYANPDKININPLIINNLEESQSYRINFRLSNPIQCHNPHVLCNVVLEFTNPMPEEIRIDPCILEWRIDDWDITKYVIVTALEDFVDDGEREIIITTENLISNAVFYENFNPEDITIRTRSHPTGHCSSTGDPHLTTFDGYHYHFYGRGYVKMVHNENLEIQAITHGGRYSRNCAVAVREFNDLVIMDVCDGSFEITERISTTGENRPTIYSRGGNQYIVDFVSGIQVQAHIWGNNMNVYINIPGSYRGKVYGMCGNFDGNSGNENTQGYVINSYSSLPSEWKVNPSESLWTWEPTSIINDEQDTIENSFRCRYSRPLQHRPIISNANVEDITELIISTRQRNTDNLHSKNYTFVPASIVEELQESISEELARELCSNRIYFNTIAEKCIELGNVDLNIYMNNCVEDLILMGDEQYMDNAYNDMINMCELEIYRNLTNWIQSENSYIAPINIIRELCVDGCSRHGNCIDGVCICSEGYGGSNCMVNLNQEVEVNSIYPYSCDFNNPEECGNYVRINGNNYLNSTELTCIYKTYYGNYSQVWTEYAKYIGYSIVMCPTPMNNTIQSIMINIEISNNNSRSSDYYYESYDSYLNRINDNSVNFVWHDFCHICNELGVCDFRENMCYFENDNINSDMPFWMSQKCIRNGDVSYYNECKQCDPFKNRTNWSYNIESYMCQPKFRYREYNSRITENIYYNETIQLDVFNNLVPSDEYNITFDCDNNYDFVNINKHTGELTITGIFNYEERQDYEINLYIKDDNIIVDNVKLTIDIIDINEIPILSQNEYEFNVTYDLSQNRLYYDEMIISVIDPDIYADNILNWNKLTYSISNFRDLFSINPEEGLINVNRMEMIRYINEHIEQLQTRIIFDIIVRIRDGGNEIIETNVRINFISSSYDWIVNTSSAELTSEPKTIPVNITELTDTPYLVNNIQDYEPTDTPIETNNNTTNTTESVSTELLINLEDEILRQESQQIKKTDMSIIIVIIGSLFLVSIVFLSIYKYYIYNVNNENIDSNKNMIFNPIYIKKNINRPILENSTYETVIPNVSTLRNILSNYKWFKPSLNNYDCKNLLSNKGQGAFIISNYYGEANNYFMIIKNNNKLVKQDIMYDNTLGFCIYGVINPPYFKSIPDLVKYYSEPRKEFKFKLVDGLPKYDNAHLKSLTNRIINKKVIAHFRNKHYVTDGPTLPIKNRYKK